MSKFTQQQIEIATKKSAQRKNEQRLDANRSKAGYSKMSPVEQFRYNQKADAQELARIEKARVLTESRKGVK